MATRDENQLLKDLLRAQAELRVLDTDNFVELLFGHESQGFHNSLLEVDGKEAKNDPYRSNSPASVPAGTPIIISPTENAIDVPWADFWRPAQSPNWEEFPCANGTDCIGAGNSCLSWADCAPDEWCEDFTCVPRDPNRPCDETWECPPPPNEDQWYECVDGSCELTCKDDADCPEGQLCDPETFICTDGCTSDEECDPKHPDPAPDAKPGSFCVNYQCVTPCDPPRLCKGPNDKVTCGPAKETGEVCKDKLLRAPSDPEGPLYECQNGCWDRYDCPDFEFDLGTEDEDGELIIYAVPQDCLDGQCTRLCTKSSQCIQIIGEGCVEGECRNIGTVCQTDQDCDDGKYCDEDGRCQSGCRARFECFPACSKDPECVETCPPDPTCTCTDVYTEEDCGTSYTQDWRDYCERDPACTVACPFDPDCAADLLRNYQCVDRSCKVLCQESKDCGGEGYVCRTDQAIEFTAPYERCDDDGENCEEIIVDFWGECQWTNNGGGNGGREEEICTIIETCDEPDENGDVNCTQKEECSFVSPYVGPDFYGCDCAEVCDQYGQCVQAICERDGDCEPCSYCRQGVCVPGCDEENPCVEGECCIDGKCKPSCRRDSDCIPGETCGEGGCCVPICEGTKPCLQSEDCFDGEKCFEGFCEPGCDTADDCGEPERCTTDENGVETCEPVFRTCDDGVCWYDQCSVDADCDLNSFESCYQPPSGPSYCRKVDVPCNNDGECPPVLVDGGGLTQICVDKVCRIGCRTDDMCPTSMLCLPTSERNESSKIRGTCEYICNADDQCSSLGFGDVCVSDQKAKVQAQKYNKIIQQTGTTIEKKRWSALATSSKTGLCLTESSDVDGEYDDYCRGYEDCTDGTCIRLPCISETDCPTGSCLSDGQCGVCGSDNDCPGEGVCDLDYGCDENGENCDTEPKGACATPCIPDVQCTLDEDCPIGNFCQTITNQAGLSKNICQTGCRAISTCEEDRDCPRPDSSGSVCFEQSCRFDFDCQPIESSGGKCKKDGDCPDNEECLVETYEECDDDGNNCQDVSEGFCETTVKPTCEDGRCVNANVGCPFGEVCMYNTDPTITDYDGICEYPLIPCVDGVCQSASGTCYPGESCVDGECLQSCEEPEEGEDDPCGDGEQCIQGICRYVGFFCNSDADCPESEGECYQGKCREDLRCSKHGDCKNSRQACLDGTCRDAERCDNNRDCTRTCEEASDCRSRPSSGSECSSTGDCEGSEQCVEGRCTYPEARCIDKTCKEEDCTPNPDDPDDDCGADGKKTVCRGFCVGEDPDDTRFCGPRGICLTGQACDGDSDCNFPDICVNNTCQFVARCSSDNQCPGGTFCEGNVCVPDNRCGNDKDCTGFQFCNASGRCQEIDTLSFDGNGGGCDDCTEFCGEDFRCHKKKCQTNNDCTCNAFCNPETGTCIDKCLNDSMCPVGHVCDLEAGNCVAKEPCINDIDCPGQVSCTDEGFCDTFFNSCLVDTDCDPGVCVDGECMDCRADQDCIDLFGKCDEDGENCDCDENGENCVGDQLICFNNTCETPCYTGLTDGSCSAGLQYGDLCEGCPGSCPGGASECIEDGTVCGEIIRWDPVARRTKYEAIPCKKCTLQCEADTDCLQSCASEADCKQYEPTGAPCDPFPGLACDPAGDPYEVCPFPEESLLPCLIEGEPRSDYCANSYETCRISQETGQFLCQFDPIIGGSYIDNSCAVTDQDNSLQLCSAETVCPDGEICTFDGLPENTPPGQGVCKLPPCSIENGETCNDGVCDFVWRVPTCKGNNRCLGTEADRAYDPCVLGEVCDPDNFYCVFPPPLCIGADGDGGRGTCAGFGLIQNSLCEYDEQSQENRCTYWDNRCETNSDCQRMSDIDGQPRYCREYECEVGELCIGNSDCEPGEICEDMTDADGVSLGIGSVCVLGPGWNDDVAECASDDECSDGKVCFDRACAFACGEDVQAFPCRPSAGEGDTGILCPPDYTCNQGTNLCERPGYDGIDQFMTGCAKGETCFKGACVPVSGENGGGGGGDGDAAPDPDYECRSPLDCNEELCNAQKRTKWDCQQGQCVEVWREEYPARPGETMCTDPERVEDDEQTDNCESQGKCCSDRGFCESCGCDDENPCENSDECCDRDSGLCINRKLHPQTEFGAPSKCSFDEVFCEVLAPEGDDGERSTVDVTSFRGEGYKGCRTEILPDGTEYTKCWEGGPLSPSQIGTILLQECTPYEEKEECDCEDTPPLTNECYTDLDCGKGANCVAKTWNSTPCCPVADEFGNDSVTRFICDGEGGEDKGCQSDADCTECEECYGASADGENVNLGTCREACDKKCPCGGQLSKGNTYQGGKSCPTCEERFGEGCITQVEAESSPAGVDPETGLDIPAGTACDCQIKQDNPCCEMFYDRGAAGECGDEPTLDCRFGALRSSRDGCAYREYKDSEGKIVVGQVDYCQDFEAGLCARCTLDSHCPGNAVCVDYECANECGGENEIPVTGNCHCCTTDLECKEKYESWSETRDSERGVETRACACTKDGIECQPWKGQESCYTWVLEDEGSGDVAKGERERKQEELERAILDEITAETNLALAFEVRNTAQTNLNAAEGEVDKQCGDYSEACINSAEGFYEAGLNKKEAEDNLETANNDKTDMIDVQQPALEEALGEAQAAVDAACPSGAPGGDGEDGEDGGDAGGGSGGSVDGPDCDTALEALGEAQDALDTLLYETIPNQNVLIENIEAAIEGYEDEMDYWTGEIQNQCPEGYEPCNPDDGPGCDTPTSKDETQECIDAETNVSAKRGELSQANTDLNTAIINLQNAEYRVRELESQIEETIYTPPVWKQVRTCGCCIDGECRDEDECTYGTCYLCRAEDYGDATKYRAAAYLKQGGAVSINQAGQEFCSGCVELGSTNSLDNHKDCPDKGFVNDIGGATAIYFEPASECVKYRCEDGIRTYQEFCSGDMNSWYDYCIGSIFGCLFSDNDDEDINYWNGYDLNMWCPLAGVWAYNGKSADPQYNSTFFTIVPPPSQGGDWVQLTKAKKSSERSSCAYPNPLGHMGPGQNWLPPFSGMGSLHPCCGESDIIHECDPEHPDCTVGFELLYESGDPSLLIKRLEAEVKALEAYDQNLDDVKTQLDDLKRAKDDEKAGLQAELDGLDSGITDIENAILETENAIEKLEGDIDSQTTTTTDKQSDYEEAKADLDSVSEEKNEAIITRDDLQDQYDQTEALRDEAVTNHTNAKAARDAKQGEVTNETNNLKALQMEAGPGEDGLNCVCGWSPSDGGLEAEIVECTETDDDGNVLPPPGDGTIECFDKMQEIELKKEEVNTLQGEYDDLVAAVNSLQEEIDGYNEDLDDQTGDLEDAKREVTRLTSEWQDKSGDVVTARNDWQTEVTTLKGMKDDLNTLNTNLKNLEKQLETAEGTEGTKQDLEDAIEKIDEILENIQESYTFVSDEKSDTADAIEDKNDEIERLNEEWCPEAEGEDCAKPQPSKRPDEGKTPEELKELYDATVEEVEEKENEKWYPAGQQ